MTQPQYPQPPDGGMTFPCPTCGAPLPNMIAAGTNFPCPMCKNPVTAPGGGYSAAQVNQMYQGVAEQANTWAAVADARAGQQDPRRASFASTSAQVLIKDTYGRYLVVGSHVDQSQQWAFRAQDARTGQLTWESARDLHLTVCPGLDRMGVRGNLLLVSADGVLRCYDPASGQPYWAAPLNDNVNGLPHSDAGDEMDLHLVNGIIVLRTEHDRVIGLDASSGSLLWHRHAEARIQPIPHLGAFLAFDDGIEILDLRTGQSLAEYRGSEYDEAALLGRYLVLEMEDQGDEEDEEGFGLLDPQTGRLLGFVNAPYFDLGSHGCLSGAIGNLIVANASTTEGSSLYVMDPSQPPRKAGFFAKMLGGGKGSSLKRLPEPTSYSFTDVRTSDDAICVQATPMQGGPISVKVLDPGSLAIRHDSGPLSGGATDAHLVARGPFAAYVVSADPQGAHNEVRMVHTTSGQLVWSRPIGSFHAHHFLDDGLAVYFDQDLLLLRASDGAVLAGYPAPS